MEIKNKEIVYALEDSLQNLFNKNLLKIILYGSYARGEEDAESDLDFLVLTDLPDIEIRKLENDLTKISTELSLEYNSVISIMALNSTHYNEYLDILPFFKNVSSDGIELYG